MPTIRSLLFPSLLVGLLAVSTRAQLAGDVPQLRLTDGQGLVAPLGPGPFNNSGVFEAAAGQVFSAELDYLAVAPPNDGVLWALLVSSQKTLFPTTAYPPPLFTQPPFLVVIPSPFNLDGLGEGSHSFAVPPGLFDGSVFIQAIVQDGSAPSPLRLSNGVRVDVVPPPFAVAFSFARESPFLTGNFDIEGVGKRDLDGDTVNTFPPFGTVAPPTSDVDPDVGLPPGFLFLPIVPNAPDGPINPLSPPVTRLTKNLTDSPADNEFFVEDTAFFPSEGRLIVSFQQNLPWGKKAGNGQPPKAEVVTYRGKTGTSFLNVSRRRLGSSASNSMTFPHLIGEFVVGEFTMATTAGAASRTRVSLDATNSKLPHVVVPAFSFTPAGGGSAVSMDLDLYRYRDPANNDEGFAVLDRVSHTWRLIGDSIVPGAVAGHVWDPMVVVSPDRRFFLAVERADTGPIFMSDPDRIWAVRLDGEHWPASGSETWEITYELAAEPVLGDTNVRSRKVEIPSIAILGSGPNDWVAYVGLDHKFNQSPNGLVVASVGGVPVAYEAAYVLEQMLVRDYIEIPLVAPGSGDALPSMPRPWITSSFAAVGSGDAVLRFDPQPVVAADSSRMVVSAGPQENIEDVYVVRSVSVTAGGQASRIIQNLSGHGAGLAGGAPDVRIRDFDQGGHGLGPKAALSPSGARVAFVVREKTSDTRDFIHVARTNGSDFAMVGPVKGDDTQSWLITGPLTFDRQVFALYWLDDDRLVFLMGKGNYFDPFGFSLASNTPATDLFLYRVSTDELVNLTNTGHSATGFGALGSILPAGSFRSESGRYVFFLRAGVISQGNTVLPPGTKVMNVFAVDAQTETVFDVSGDEFGELGPLRNVTLPAADAIVPVESVAPMRFVNGAGVQAGTVWFTADEAGLASGADELFCFNGNAPFIGVQLTEFSPPGSHITNIVADPYASRAAFAQTATSDALGKTQHPFVADLSSFVFVRDLTPSLVNSSGPFGRVMDGSFHFIPPAPGVPDALVFSVGVDVDPADGLARDCAAVYYSMANVSDLLLEPDAVLVGILSTFDIGPDNRIYITSAGPASAP